MLKFVLRNKNCRAASRGAKRGLKAFQVKRTFKFGLTMVHSCRNAPYGAKRITKTVNSKGAMVSTQFGGVGNFYPKSASIVPPTGAVAARVTVFDGSGPMHASGLGAKVTSK